MKDLAQVFSDPCNGWDDVNGVAHPFLVNDVIKGLNVSVVQALPPREAVERQVKSGVLNK